MVLVFDKRWFGEGTDSDRARDHNIHVNTRVPCNVIIHTRL